MKGGQINLYFTTLPQDDKYKMQHIENNQVLWKGNAMALPILSSTEP